MSIDAAIHNQIFLKYLVVVGGILVFAGLVLGILRLLGKDVSGPARTYRGWLIMIPLVLGMIFLGRVATIIGVTLLAIFGFKEFARATGLYQDWWMTGTVYMGITLLGAVTIATDPRLEYLVAVESKAARHAFRQVAPLDGNFQDLLTGECRTDFELDAFGRGFTDQDAVIAAYIIGDRLVKTVAADTHGCGVDNAVQRDDSDFRCAATDVEHHGATRFVNGQSRTDRRRHGFINKVYFTCAGAFGGFADSAPLYLGGTVGNTDENPRAGPEITRLMRFADEMLQHLLGDREIRDNAVFQGPNSRNIAWRATQHVLGLGAHGLDNAAPTRILANCDDRRLIEHDAGSARVNEGVGSAKVNRQVIGKVTQ